MIYVGILADVLRFEIFSHRAHMIASAMIACFLYDSQSESLKHERMSAISEIANGMFIRECIDYDGAYLFKTNDVYAMKLVKDHSKFNEWFAKFLNSLRIEADELKVPYFGAYAKEYQELRTYPAYYGYILKSCQRSLKTTESEIKAICSSIVGDGIVGKPYNPIEQAKEAVFKSELKSYSRTLLNCVSAHKLFRLVKHKTVELKNALKLR